ncbi:hypothetical protein [Streptomyces calidiresistens]|uniref:Uncharacterized protein n=1 Tax=Streptomyces calidiresistens TaxID=1485586 RepID=A0A7W3T8W8_9ACTN|nr:hypothetical protein [Streptomyces calidiresistens]MBB0233132.1 hypothetical protein [Streptomyces calidiresistens]
MRSQQTAPAQSDFPASPARPGSPVEPDARDPLHLSEFQLDELSRKLLGRVIRLLRAELRLDRERIGRLRDNRR